MTLLNPELQISYRNLSSEYSPAFHWATMGTQEQRQLSFIRTVVTPNFLHPQGEVASPRVFLTEAFAFDIPLPLACIWAKKHRDKSSFLSLMHPNSCLALSAFKKYKNKWRAIWVFSLKWFNLYEDNSISYNI